jgi:hypothetical protein
MEGLAASIQNGTVSVINGPMKDELEAFEFVYSRSGVKYSAPDGVHDDAVCSLALAVQKWKLVPKGGPTITFHR